jgi:hypothetical protein
MLNGNCGRVDMVDIIINALLSKGISIGINEIEKSILKCLNMQCSQLDNITDIVNQIETKLDVIINAPIVEAKKYYQLGETEKYKEKLIEAISKNPLMLSPRLLYIKLMLEKKRFDIVLEEYWDIIDYFGMRSDIVPIEIIDAYKLACKNTLSIPNDSFTLCSFAGGKLKDGRYKNCDVYINEQLEKLWMTPDIIISCWRDYEQNRRSLIIADFNGKILLRNRTFDDALDILMLTKKFVIVKTLETFIFFDTIYVRLYDIPNFNKIYEYKCSYKKNETINWNSNPKLNEYFGLNQEIPFLVYDKYNIFPSANKFDHYDFLSFKHITEFGTKKIEINDNLNIEVGRSEEHSHEGGIRLSKSFTAEGTFYDSYFKISKKKH